MANRGGGRSAASSSTTSPSMLSAWLSISSGPYVCSTCSKSFPSSQALGGHQNAHRKLREEVRVRFLQERLEMIRTNNNNLGTTYSQSPPNVLPLQPDFNTKLQYLTMSIGGGAEHAAAELDFWRGHHDLGAMDDDDDDDNDNNGGGYGKGRMQQKRNKDDGGYGKAMKNKVMIQPLPSLELSLASANGYETLDDEMDPFQSFGVNGDAANLDLTLRL